MNIRLGLSWILVILSVFLHAVTILPTTVGVSLFVANIGLVVLVRVLARRGM